MSALLEISNLNVTFKTRTGKGYAVTDVNASVERNKVTAIVGESGSGKSVLGSAIVGLLPVNAKAEGSIVFDGRELIGLSDTQYDSVRGEQIGWVAQNAISALNPSFKIKELVSEAPFHKRRIKWKQKRAFANEQLRKANLCEAVAENYSFELSGGMAQRALIATGIGLDPSFLILDEPTKGLDPVNTESIKDLILALARSGKTLLVITHDVKLAKEIADQVWVFYGSKIVEMADADSFFDAPAHPYSQGLLDALPSRGLKAIAGESPSFYTRPSGCPFEPRCPHARPECVNWSEFVNLDDRQVLCLKYC
ncbi:ABC transporter ATP-binding protein [Propionimicrobium lymphophilum]|uniref:ABC transporter ATP-binding protein n=1 Tax=Propionimicrobium lymphophilum TaxID=33012 RepID=UPI000416DD67|nr:ABC transporter ATP-binding protein [Propionimicrobium lymphophilum]